MNKWPSILGALGLTLGLAGAADAALTAVDPGPYTLATGRFPMWYQDDSEPVWYQDASGPRKLKLELCQSRALSSRVASAPGAPSYMCTLLPEPGIFDDAQPMVFPDNWPPELFWFLAEATIPAVGNSGYEMDAYVAGIEAAFAGGNPVDGDQQSFARIRMRISVPVAGTYKITHPYGVEEVTVTTPGRRAINITRDIGIGAPGDFSGALAGQVGPFLQSVNGPYVEINPDTGANETFIGDPNLTEAVTGSPNNTNFVRIEGPAGTIETNLFTLSGKAFDDRAQTAVEIQRSSYARTSAGIRYEVFASAQSNAALCMRDTLALVPGTPPSPCQVNLISDNNGRFFAKQDSTGDLPPFLVVTASDPTGTTKPTAISRKLVDVVKISTARYAWDTHTLTVEASSSDQVGVPDLVAQGFGRMSKGGILQTLTVTDLAQPPASITVKSAAGGSDTEPVTVIGGPTGGQPDNQAPIAVADTASTLFNTPVQINLLANDSDPDNDTPLTVVDLVQPALGSVTLGADGVATYSPPVEPLTAFVAVFSYSIQDPAGMRSQPATVTVNVAADQPPVAVNDSGATSAGQALTLNVLANDSDPDGHVPLTIASVTQPPAGQGTVTDNGTSITYTPPANVTQTFDVLFTYQARDAFGATSNTATVTVRVSPPAVAENLIVTAATVQARAGNRFVWDFGGTTSLVAGNTLQINVTTTTGTQSLGTVTVPRNGRWRLSVTSTTIIPTANPTAEVISAFGTRRIVSVIRR